MSGRSKTMVNEPLKSIAEVAEYCGVPINTVYKWNTSDRGPRRYKVGRHVRYRSLTSTPGSTSTPSAVSRWPAR
jgi:excisionase family DNA binding protein